MTMNKTISMCGLGTVTPDFNGKGVSFEFWADDPDGQVVQPMKTTGTAQLMRSGSFFFVPSKKRVRNNSLLIRKARHGRLSGTRDHGWQLTLKVFATEGIDWQRAFVVEPIEVMTDLMGPERMREILKEALKRLELQGQVEKSWKPFGAEW